MWCIFSPSNIYKSWVINRELEKGNVLKVNHTVFLDEFAYVEHTISPIIDHTFFLIVQNLFYKMPVIFLRLISNEINFFSH